jgi:hypothetical protein
MSGSSDFDAVPDREDVSRVERDLRFHPVDNDSPRTLSKDQIASYNDDGFLSGISIFDDDEIAVHRAYFDELLDRIIGQGGDAYSISTAHLTYGRVYDLLTHPRIVAAVVDMLGENVIAWGSHYFCKLAGDPKTVAWHQDASYWPLSHTKTATVWLAIDDADVENACMRFLRGSHRFGHITWRESDASEKNVLDQTIDDAEEYGEPFANVLAAGQISIHSDLLIHGSDANLSTRRRCGLTLRYCSADVRAGMGWNSKGVIVNGEDSSGHWANPSRPESD